MAENILGKKKFIELDETNSTGADMTALFFDLQTPWYDLAVVHMVLSIAVGMIVGMIMLALTLKLRDQRARHREKMQEDAAEALESLFEEWSCSSLSMERNVDRFIAEESDQKLATIIRLDLDK